MILACTELFKVQYILMIVKKSTDRYYYFNILKIITLIYHMYIDYELYNLANNKNTGFLQKHQFISSNWLNGMITIQ